MNTPEPGSPADVFPEISHAARMLSNAIDTREKMQKRPEFTANLRGILARAIRRAPKGRPLDPITAKQLFGWEDRAHLEP